MERILNTKLVIIAAMTKNRVIGKDGEIPWHLKDDLRHFARVTNGCLVIMGRKTYESVIRRLNGPLPERITLVLTRQESFMAATRVLVAHSWEETMEHAAKYKTAFVCGGAELYALALPHANEMYLTLVDADCDGDVFFPPYQEKDWQAAMRSHYPKSAVNDYPFEIDYLIKKGVHI